MWKLYENDKIDANNCFINCCTYIHSGGGGEKSKFSALVPLFHMFGFCENYEKLMYRVKHEITLNRTDEDASVISNETEAEADKVR